MLVLLVVESIVIVSTCSKLYVCVGYNSQVSLITLVILIMCGRLNVWRCEFVWRCRNL